jgi:hypothetical protein
LVAAAFVLKLFTTWPEPSALSSHFFDLSFWLSEYRGSFAMALLPILGLKFAAFL